MKILQVVPFFTPNRGGSVTGAYNLSRELYKKGHEVALITSDFEFDEEYARSLVGIDTIPFKCMANLGLFLYTPKMKHWLNENIRHFDIIHIHNFRSYQNNIVHYYAKKYGVPYVLQPHGSLPTIMEKCRLKQMYDFVWGNKLLTDASSVIALTNMEVEQFNQTCVVKCKIFAVPNGIVLSEFNYLQEGWKLKNTFKKKYGINSDEKIILFLGRLHKIKGIDLLVTAFADLAKDYNNVILVIAGPDDGFLPALKEQIDVLKINDKVLITGPLYGSDKIEAYYSADVYVLPSIYETFPITVLEACACGKPVVVTDRCGIADIVDSNVGYVVGYDKNQLRDAILEILNDEGLKKRFGDRGKEMVREKFEWNQIASKMEALYETAVRT